MRGRKPNPAKAAGTADHSTESVADNRMPGAIVEPAWTILAAPNYAEGVAALAAEKWRELAGEMTALGTLGPENALALEILCVQYARWRLAEAEVAKYAPVIRAPKTGVAMQNPFLSIANAAADRFLKFAAELGLTPAMRGRVEKRPLKASNAPLRAVKAL